MDDQLYVPEYTDSWALVIGIDDYRNAYPLSFACNDARAVYQILIDAFDFPEPNVTLLTDKEASQASIREAFLRFRYTAEPNDRILVFFAGHGHTEASRRGEVGFLVPVDGDPDRVSSLIRWDELTRNADLFAAKHVFFVMDACYGGLARTRGLPSGSMRFLKDMLQRFSRQVLTAGKADEVVSDSGGPLPGHSLFTGHFLQALQGEAATPEGVITANTVMAYVYERVSTDQYSQQTPDFGFIDGDGDFIFEAPMLSEITKPSETGQDVLVEIPPTTVETAAPDHQSLIDVIKQYIPDRRYRIKLDDLTTQEIKRVLSLTTADSFPVHNVALSTEELSDRLKRYETITRDLQAITALLAHWGSREHTPVLRKIISRLAEHQGARGGITAWINLRWYPVTVLVYSGGIGAIAAENYDNLVALLTTRVSSEHNRGEEVVLPLVQGLTELDRRKVFNLLPGHERYYFPRSEYLFKVLQSDLDDLLFLGRSYEAMFDRFEILLALVHADLYSQTTGRARGPFGRFTWKHARPDDTSVFTELLKEAESQKDDWPPLKAGLFGGSYERFSQVSAEYGEIINRLKPKLF